MAASCDLLDVVPPVLQFQFVRGKQASCRLCLFNKTRHTVAFKVKTTNPKNYSVRPNMGVIPPRSSCMVEVTRGAPRVSYQEFQCKDKFLVQSVVVSDHLSAKDITSQTFTMEKGNAVEEVKLMVYVMPPEQTSEIAERRDGSALLVSPMQQIVDNGRSTSYTSDLSSGSVSMRSAEMGTVVGTPVGQIVQLPLLSSLDAKLAEGKNFVLEQNRELRQELEVLRREVSRWTLLLVVGLLCIILGYLIKK
ncbi:hypothetical protein EJB05_23784 [Eragrostis curvula]|uniref:MSP domain-containing protein n=1 Tax=Eragrostis curvula TaxID=38414 RepID=A0A5J9V7Y4_9POAL|nr:hypothetical protein EJB05_23784 [Eragrostis curvula]